jgi:hypothetical protein
MTPNRTKERTMLQKKLKELKKGELFKRKPEAKTTFIREHFNRADSWGPASYCCVDAADIGRSIQLNPLTLVYVES